ncbi:unnamed protein product [Penicillium pancosmium]
MATNAAEQDGERDQISQSLLPTSFACSSLSRLSGGTANYVYRGTLSGSTKSIIIKHTKGHSASNPDFKIDSKRCHFEVAILRALSGLPPYSEAGVTVKAPELLHFDAETDTQIVEDLPDSVDLKTFLLSNVSSDVSKASAEAVGRALGSWLRSFHDWGNSKDQLGCKATLGENESMKQLKFWSRDVFEQVRDFAATELTKENHDDGFGIIHGDFWTGNVLIPNVAIGSHFDTTLFVVDWELAQIGSRALDLGQMIAELYETKLFKEVEAGVWIIEGLLQGYGGLSDEMAFRTAIHVGVHLICWGSRVPGWGSKEQIEEVVKIGNDMVIGGWAKDKQWFESHELGFFFKK